MDDFLTFLYQQYFDAKSADVKWAQGTAIPADAVDVYKERQKNDLRALTEAELRIKKYMRSSYAEIKRLPSG